MSARGPNHPEWDAATIKSRLCCQPKAAYFKRERIPISQCLLQIHFHLDLLEVFLLSCPDRVFRGFRHMKSPPSCNSESCQSETLRTEDKLVISCQAAFFHSEGVISAFLTPHTGGGLFSQLINGATNLRIPGLAEHMSNEIPNVPLSATNKSSLASLAAKISIGNFDSITAETPGNPSGTWKPL